MHHEATGRYLVRHAAAETHLDDRLPSVLEPASTDTSTRPGYSCLHNLRKAREVSEYVVTGCVGQYLQVYATQV
jgi:hypothetical protein